MKRLALLLSLVLLIGCGDSDDPTTITASGQSTTSTHSATTETEPSGSSADQPNDEDSPADETTSTTEEQSPAAEAELKCERLPDGYAASHYDMDGATVKTARVRSTATSNNPPLLSDGFYFVSTKVASGAVATFLETVHGSAFAVDPAARSLSAQGADTPLPDISPQTPGYRESRDCVS